MSLIGAARLIIKGITRLESETATQNKYSEDVRIINKNGREFIIVGTAHISRQSADLVKEVITNEKPDTVCIELDEKRYKALLEKKRWESLDLKTIIRQKQLSTLLVNLVLSSYQKNLAKSLVLHQEQNYLKQQTQPTNSTFLSSCATGK